jgi:hypothetical protein
VHQQAVKMNVEGVNYRRIGHLLGVDHKTVMHWVKAPVPVKVNNAEQDELFTFVGKKKQLRDDLGRPNHPLYSGMGGSSERNKAVLQQVVDAAPQAAF